ncbi:unnamed protein product [Lactuca saligna]|uniref:Carboxypeptidase n=1 Tax=Lactuca saligna TaxID=75948 RepID=A0AA35Z6U2_LACSI|nr:unnamed protein product [Lactuca saligna]
MSAFFAIESTDICVYQSNLCKFRIQMEIPNSKLPQFRIEMEMVAYTVVELEKNPYSWTKVANIIFLDQPVGTGFSYAKTPDAYITNDTLSSMHAYHFLRKWLVDHPKFLNNPFYLGGESYMGIVAPMIVNEIYKGNEVGEGPQIKIKGYMLGNPLTDTSGDYNSRIPFLHRTGLLSNEIYKSTKENCHGNYLDVDPNNHRCINDLKVVDKCIGRINKPQILEPACDTSNTIKSYHFRRGLVSLHNASMDIWSLPQVRIQGCRDDHYIYSYVWANRRDVREALHIDEEFDEIKWVRCNESLFFNFFTKPISNTHNVLNTVAYHENLANKNCRALVFSGDHDMVVP